MKSLKLIIKRLIFSLVFLLSITTSIFADSQKAVLVTGASSGIGKNITEMLAKRGYFVYAGARKDKDLKMLDAMDNVKSVRLDVTKQDEIDAAVKMISEQGRGLYGLVNNAGVAIVDTLIEVPEDDIQFLFDVNVFGVYRVTKAFAPLIIESKGRITTIGSISGIGSGFFFGPYSMTKHAMEAYTDSLAKEMKKFDVKVSIVEPGNYDSKIGASLLKRRAVTKKGFVSEYYKKENDDLLKSFTEDRSKEKSPEEVSESVVHALFSEHPKRRYLTVPKASEAKWAISTIMLEMLQLNKDQPYTYTRDELIEMMDGLSKKMQEMTKPPPTSKTQK